MAKKIHKFQDSYTQGLSGESQLDILFKADFDIRPVERMFQRKGIDRVFIRKSNSKRFTVEYKSDMESIKTGNAFIEVVSVDTAGKVGWAISSQAEVLIYYIPFRRVSVFRMDTIKAMLPTWQGLYPKGEAINETYSTYGLKIPLGEFYNHIISLDEFSPNLDINILFPKRVITPEEIRRNKINYIGWSHINITLERLEQIFRQYNIRVTTDWDKLSNSTLDEIIDYIKGQG